MRINGEMLETELSLPEKEAVPRIWMDLSVCPGVLDPEVMYRPGMAPWRAAATFGYGRSPRTSSIFTVVTAPERFIFFWTP